MLVPGHVILLSLLLADTIGVRANVLQLSRPLMVLVMRSVVITSRHIRYALFAPIWCGLPAQACKLDSNSPAPGPHARLRLHGRLFHYVPPRYDGRAPQVRVARRPSGVRRA